ncbi:coenzyme A pyrophosphatase [Rhizocola hellebori]|uniref:Coenzyme A pyrophosphatase n=1 Tax=Rhizocola hellebori TaxID=1392758 RepID=A0A8J3VJR4_9ACTN|nr:CoA pyrophosphatase [Rhizocola hellebori]GIH08980.1 coenzyme A pyrophosphatase [Rhizocola hellebori]
MTTPAWLEPLLNNTRVNDRAAFTGLETPQEGRPAGVLVLFGEDPKTGPDMLVLQRSATMRTHAGQVAFPGGAAEPDDADISATALREAQEEVGLDPQSVTVLASLPQLWIPVSDFLVTPVLAWWHSPHPVVATAPAEVAHVARLPIQDLADPDNRLRVRHPSGFTGPAFQVHGMLVWGFTAGVISALLELGGWAKPWDTSRVEMLPSSQFQTPSVG